MLNVNQLDQDGDRAQRDLAVFICISSKQKAFVWTASRDVRR